MTNFYPGPSKIYPELGEYYTKGLASGIFSMNHRSEAFHQLYADLKAELKSYLNIPNDYEIGVISSATEAWEITTQSFNLPFHHYYNGAFGKKWFTQNQQQDKQAYVFDVNKSIDSLNIENKTGIICLTNSETSNGTFISNESIAKIKKQNPKALIAVDATSILGGYPIDFKQIDICFSSVQKCLGQAPGMAILFFSPEVKKHFHSNSSYYNDLKTIEENALKNETTHTPNIPGIYVLNQTLKNLDSLENNYAKLQIRKDLVLKAFAQKSIYPICTNELCISPTILAFDCQKIGFDKINQLALEHQIIIGKGYGEHKSTSFRIANFPAHTDQDLELLLHFIKNI